MYETYESKKQNLDTTRVEENIFIFNEEEDNNATLKGI